jgi:hypothetical protein
MAQAITGAIPFQAPTPPRMLDELSGQIGKMTPIAPRRLRELARLPNGVRHRERHSCAKTGLTACRSQSSTASDR